MAHKVKEKRKPHPGKRAGAVSQGNTAKRGGSGKTRSKDRPVEAAAKRGARVAGETTISSKNQVTIPVAVLRDAGFNAGDKVKVEFDGAGWIRIGPADESVDQLVDRLSGSLTGVYGPDYLERLRKEDW